MELDHERLDVYHLALDFLVMANGIIEALPRGRSHLADQFTRASTSIVLNLSEGAGKLSKPDKRRYYLTARGSATESAALLDVCHRLELIESVRHAPRWTSFLPPPGTGTADDSSLIALRRIGHAPRPRPRL
jgi:four helix bundle protein